MPTSAQVQSFLGKAIREQGYLPRCIVSDKGRQFTSRSYKRWCGRRGIRRRFANGISRIWQFYFSADRERFLVLSDRNPGLLEVRLTESGAPVPENLGHQLPVVGLAFSPDGRYLVSTDIANESIAWDVGARRAVARVAVPWNRRGSYFPIAGRSRWVCISGVDDLSIQSYGGLGEPRLLRGAGPDLGMMALSSDERDAAVLNEQTDRLCVWDVQRAAERWCRDLEKKINFAELQFSGDDSLIVALSETGELLRWQRADGVPMPSVTLKPDHAGASEPGPTATVVTRQRLPDDDCESWLVQEASAGKVQFSSTKRRGPLWRSAELPSLHCSFTPDNRLAVLPDDEGQITLQRVSDGDELAVLTGHQGAVWTFAISPDGALLATGGKDHVIYLWDLSRYR
jgi:WD40 repeat protein